MTLARYLPRFRQAYRSLEELESREKWSRAQIEAFQLQRLNALWVQATTQVAYYQRLCEAKLLPRQFASLEEFHQTVPIVERDHVARWPGEFLSVHPPAGIWRRTSGSTGTPVRGYWSHTAHQEMLRCKYRFLKSWGIDIFDRTAFLWDRARGLNPQFSALIERFIEHIQDWLRNRIRLSAYTLGQKDLQLYLVRLRSFQPALLYGFSTAMYLLAREAREAGFSVDGLRLAVLTAEPVLSHYREEVEQAFGVPGVAEYGSVECGFLAGEGPDRTLRVREDQAVLETVPREDGRYDVVVTVLNNGAFPLIRYAIGDVTELPLQIPNVGFAILPPIRGRQFDHLLTRSGRRIHATLLEGLFEEQGALRRWRIYQYRDGTVVVGLERWDIAPVPDTERLKRQIEEWLEGFPVRIEWVSDLPPIPTAKHRRVISELAMNNPPNR